jgi:hypothetical protein
MDSERTERTRRAARYRSDVERACREFLLASRSERVQPIASALRRGAAFLDPEVRAATAAACAQGAVARLSKWASGPDRENATFMSDPMGPSLVFLARERDVRGVWTDWDVDVMTIDGPLIRPGDTATALSIARNLLCVGHAPPADRAAMAAAACAAFLDANDDDDDKLLATIKAASKVASKVASKTAASKAAV